MWLMQNRLRVTNGPSNSALHCNRKDTMDLGAVLDAAVHPGVVRIQPSPSPGTHSPMQLFPDS